MSVVIVKYRFPGIYVDTVIVCANMDVAVASMRKTMCEWDDHRTLVVKQARDCMTPWIYYGYIEGQESESRMDSFVTFEDYTSQRCHTEATVIGMTKADMRKMERSEARQRAAAKKKEA